MDLTKRRQKDTAELIEGLANGRFVLMSYSHSSYSGEPDRIRAEFTVYPRSVEKNWFALSIKKVIFNDPATIVFWEDGTKTVVKCGENDIFDPEKGLAMAIAKKALSNKGNYYNLIKKWLPEKKDDGSGLSEEKNVIQTAIATLQKAILGQCDVQVNNNTVTITSDGDD